MIYTDTENQTAIKVEAVRYESRGWWDGKQTVLPMVGHQIEMFRLLDGDGPDQLCARLGAPIGVFKLDRIQADRLLREIGDAHNVRIAP